MICVPSPKTYLFSTILFSVRIDLNSNSSFLEMLALSLIIFVPLMVKLIGC